MSEQREYLIASPGYASICGGIKSLHKLAHELNNRGYNAYVTGYMNPEFNTKSISTLSQEHLRELQHKGVIVYPDIVDKNACNFTNVCRWWMGATQPPGINELTFAFSDMHQVVHKYQHTLFVWHIEDFFIEPSDGIERKGTCCYAGKGSGIDHSAVVELTGNANNSVNPSGCERIHPGKYADRLKLAELFKRSELLYCYDNLSIVACEARLCGCPVVIMGHWVIPEDHYHKDEFGRDAMVIYGEDYDIDKLREELPAFRERYKLREEKTEKEIEKFIELTQTFNKEGKYVENRGVHKADIHHHKELAMWNTR